MKKGKTIDLNERLTRKARQADTVTADPAIPTRMAVTLDQLVPYDQNPRQTKNPKYEEIKDSIRNRGLDEPPSITRRPGSDYYMIRRGGNTRLQILNELWEETKEERFYRIDCMFSPWVDDEDALAGHLVENDMRGGMLLIERALGAKRWIQMLEEKSGESISQRKAAEAMTRRGWKMNQGNLSKLLYAAEGLLPHIPDALWAGMGVRIVETLRALEKGYRDYWDAIVKLSDESPTIDWETLWTDTLKEFDDIKFDVLEFRRTLDFKASDALGLSHNTLRSEVDAMLEGGNPPTERPIDPFAERPPFTEDPRKTAPTQAAPRRAEAPGPGNDQNGGSDASGGPESPRHSMQSGPAYLEGQASSPGTDPVGPPGHSEHLTAPLDGASQPRELGSATTPRSVDELQDLTYQAARTFMVEVGLEGLVAPAPLTEQSGRGFGYRLLPISQPISPMRRPFYWALLNTVFMALDQMSDVQAKSNLKDLFLPESLDTVLGTLYSDSPGFEFQASMKDQLTLTWVRTSPESIVGVPHPDRPALDALNELEHCIAALRHAVDDDLDSLFIAS